MQVDFGNLIFPDDLVIPAARELGQFSRLAHGVRSGTVTILDPKTIRIEDLHYDGAGPGRILLSII